MTPGTRVCVGRDSVKGTVKSIRGPIAQVKLDGRERYTLFLLSSLKPIEEQKIIQLPLPK